MIDSDGENCLYTVDNIIEDEDECYLLVRAPGRTHRARRRRGLGLPGSRPHSTRRAPCSQKD
eukprot:7216420-Prymnesium_polylepis.1